MKTKEDILEAIRSGELRLPPLTVQIAALEPSLTGKGADRGADAFVDISWKNRTYPFVAEIKTDATPKAFRSAIEQVRSYAAVTDRHPLVIVPYLPPDRLNELEEKEVSGVDLCGNGVVIVRPALLVVRTGNPNQYPAGRSIRNVYQGASSLVPRVFLMRPMYASVQEVKDEIAKRGGHIALSTVSKVLKALDEDLVIRRKQWASSLLQADELLKRLAVNFKTPDVSARKKYRWTNVEALERFGDWTKKVVLTGAASVEHYGVMPREKTVQCYCTSIEPIERRLGEHLEASSRFPDLELIQTRDPTVYFDARDNGEFPAASPVQCWLELQAGDKRQQDAARAVRDRILTWLAESGWSAP